MAEQLIAPKSGSRTAIAETLASYGPDITPHLVRLLDHPDAAVGTAASVALSRMGADASAAGDRLFQIAGEPGNPIAVDAAIALYYLSDSSPEFVPWIEDLLAYHSDFAVSSALLDCVGSSSELSHGYLRTALQSESKETVRRALDLIGDDPWEWMPLVSDIADVGCDSPELAPIVCEILGQMKSDGQRSLLAMFDSPDVRTRQHIIRMLALQPNLAPEAMQVVLSATTNGDSLMRFWGTRALSKVASQPAVVSRLMELTCDEDADVRWQAINALARAGLRDRPEVAARIASRLIDPSSPVRFEAARAHWRLTAETAPAREVFQQLASGSDRKLALSSEESLREMDAASRAESSQGETASASATTASHDAAPNKVGPSVRPNVVTRNGETLQ